MEFCPELVVPTWIFGSAKRGAQGSNQLFWSGARLMGHVQLHQAILSHLVHKPKPTVQRILQRSGCRKLHTCVVPEPCSSNMPTIPSQGTCSRRCFLPKTSVISAKGCSKESLHAWPRGRKKCRDTQRYRDTQYFNSFGRHNLPFLTAKKR